MTIVRVFENENLIVVDKPHAWLTTPARMADDPRPCLGRELQAQLGMQIFPVHRLDFEVSGLTLWAKNADSHRKAQRWFEHAWIRKVYEAYSRPGTRPPPQEFIEWKSKLVRGKKRSFVAEYGNPSLTQARVVQVDSKMWKWELVPVTGRPHQLRVEMSRHGFALLGDKLYGGEEVAEPQWIALRAVTLDASKIASESRLGLPEVLTVPGLNMPN